MDDTQKPKASPKDFFLHLGVIVVLYAVVGFLLNLLFTIINTAYPQVGSYYGGYVPPISFPVAALIVLFPLFVLLSWLTYMSYEIDQSKKQLGVRKWLTFLTLFVTGAVIAGDLITIIYYFLDGRDFTASFILKALSVIVVAAMVFGYYIYDLRDKVSSSQRKIWAIVAGALILVTIVLGFSVIGSPKTQRLIRYDTQKVNDLQNIQSQVVNYWQSKQKLPVALSDMSDSISGFIAPVDPQTGASYIYRLNLKDNRSFTLCADFNRDSMMGTNTDITRPKMVGMGGEFGDNWQHGAGQVCFERTIDPELYPPRKAGM